jgi:LmbE family N-acetylglucosaminyl deacetylase
MGDVPATIVFFHAHPDDETIATGGTMARAHHEGHRVVVVFATRGELGEVDPGVLDESEPLGDRRAIESQRAAAVLGAARVVFLGYRDSGMAGEDSNHAEGSFAGADLEEAATRLAAVLREEDADVLTVYDDWGTYGHPDHIKVHRVGVRAAQLGGTPRVYGATVSRQALRTVITNLRDALPDAPDPDELDLGVDEGPITTFVDVTAYLRQKRASMAAHATQIAPESFFLATTDDQFRAVFGTEWFIRLDHTPTERETWIL